MVPENKNSFFCLNLTLHSNSSNEIYIDNLDNKVDLILSSLTVKSTWYKFIKKDKSQIVHLFETNTRKRKGQVIKFCDQYFPKEQEYF
jgi:hypothetical protein